MGAGHRLLRDFFAAFPAGLHDPTPIKDAGQMTGL